MSDSPQKILLAVDGSKDSEAASLVATTLTAAIESALHVVHVGRGHPLWFERHEGLVEKLRREAQESLDRRVAMIEDVGGIVSRTHLRMSKRPADSIVDVGEEIGAGMIVLGRRQGGLRRAVRGGVSDSVVRRAHCPVLIVHGQRPTDLGRRDARRKARDRPNRLLQQTLRIASGPAQRGRVPSAYRRRPCSLDSRSRQRVAAGGEAKGARRFGTGFDPAGRCLARRPAGCLLPDCDRCSVLRHNQGDWGRKDKWSGTLVFSGRGGEAARHGRTLGCPTCLIEREKGCLKNAREAGRRAVSE